MPVNRQKTVRNRSKWMANGQKWSEGMRMPHKNGERIADASAPEEKKRRHGHFLSLLPACRVRFDRGAGGGSHFDLTRFSSVIFIIKTSTEVCRACRRGGSRGQPLEATNPDPQTVSDRRTVFGATLSENGDFFRRGRRSALGRRKPRRKKIIH